ncbi:hypothetical protein ACWF9B_08810 [Streptomyces sp. NPDC055089]
MNSAQSAAMFLHTSGYASLAADGGGISSSLGRWGSGGLCLILVILLRGLIKSGKANTKPWLLAGLGAFAAAAFANAAGVWRDVLGAVRDATSMVSDLGLGEATPAALGVCVFLILWLYDLEPVQRVVWGFIVFVMWSAADGSLPEAVSSFFVKLANKFGG